ncbi:class I SAM-dependent methyltransferase [Nocardioides zeae]|uniref:Class I SAM-dependent methyltransferase n=1 Tax=Nocardioides imazamoxiresistens TaxID=3231893 RepID=A0ABU3PW40_9ACTN|nr:class I SAM-dependent methyltransferase [Nocardioides zeae]MDT9593450.1 class I SAM-dependent methyltransferase [Nocardioides zeae]
MKPLLRNLRRAVRGQETAKPTPASPPPAAAPTEPVVPAEPEQPREPRLDDIRGWFPASDQATFTWLLDHQRATEPAGDVVELGVFMGKSAVYVGQHLAEGERFTVVDLFDDVTDEASIPASERTTYRSLTQKTFEENYLKFHPELPVVVRGLSSVVREHVEADTCRFVHVDASHMYDHVREDAESARLLLREGGIVCFDDYRSAHTPGTAAAVWETVLDDGLQVICLTGQKLYGTWGDPEPGRAAVRAGVAASDAFKLDEQTIRDQPILRIY